VADGKIESHSSEAIVLELLSNCLGQWSSRDNFGIGLVVVSLALNIGGDRVWSSITEILGLGF